MSKSRFLTLFASIILLLFISACSSDDGDSNPTDPGNGDNPPTVNVEPITIPQKMQAAANNGNPGAAQAVAYIQIANALPTYTQLLTPPEGASKISSTSAVTGEWTWTQDGATITLVTNETATTYEWTVTVNGTFGGKTYSNQLLIEASELKDGSSGELLFYDPDTGSPALAFNWENMANGTYHLTMESAQGSAMASIDMYVNPDGSGSLDITSSGGSWDVNWASDGSGTWISYDAQGNILDQGSWS